MNTFCASIDVPGRAPCTANATIVCEPCRLVAYCSVRCRVRHFPNHVQTCKSPLALNSWLPALVLCNTEPEDDSQSRLNPFVRRRDIQNFWGNFPALDLLRIAQNETAQYNQCLSIFFEASGDLRSFIKTLVELPIEYVQPLQVVINDQDMSKAIRNVIIIILLGSGTPTARQTAIHIWYSARLTREHHKTLFEVVHPIAQEVLLEGAIDAANDRRLSRNVRLGKGSLRVVLRRSHWRQLAVKTSVTLDLAAAELSRRRAIDARKDHFDLSLLFTVKQCHRRLAIKRFKEDGILRPYARNEDIFVIPNPTLYDEHGHWIQIHSADPLHGWMEADRLRYAAGRHLSVMDNDLYGIMYHAIDQLLERTCDKLKQQYCDVHLCCQDIETLEKEIIRGLFDRVLMPVSASKHSTRIEQKLHTGHNLLNRVNPCSTLLTISIDAIAPLVTKSQWRKATWKAAKHLRSTINAQEPEGNKTRTSYLLTRVSGSMLPLDRLFDRWVMRERLTQKAQQIGLRMKTQYSITTAWPHAVQVTQDKERITEDLLSHMTSGLSGLERYTEWVVANEAE